MKKSLILLLILSCNRYSCLCYKLGENFFDTVSLHNAKIQSGEFPAQDTLTIISGKVIQYRQAPTNRIPPAMLVKVEHVLQGDTVNQEIWVEGDTDGSQCRPPVINFPLQSDYVFALNQDENKQFYLSGCGEYSLKTTTPLSR